MTSISKINASAVSATSEITLAAASLNFDFSLVKIEAPQEFQMIGKGLSHERRTDAEDGLSHTTARKLAALFEPLLDRTPELVKAYGLRVSQISSSPEVNPQGSKKQHGLFFKKVGADATSIWAAATSGHSAISIHLLACMLARMWPAEEATSIWAEIVEERRKEIQQDDQASELEKLARNAAACQQITREQLAQWDASARSWLQSADQAKGIKVKQTQMLLTLKNVSLPVNTCSTAYSSVLKAWKSAMALAEKLIMGQPQEVHDGGILLGLTAWHLYPDLVVLGQTTTKIEQKDPLISRGGILTLGLHSSRSSEESESCGISWSLPLASLNFYGDPIITTQSMDPDTPRLTIQELTFVALGSLLSAWTPMSLEFAHGAECLVEIWASLTRHDSNLIQKGRMETAKETKSDSLNERSWRWLKMLVDAAYAFLMLEGLERERAVRLIQFGQRRAEGFLKYDHQRQNNFLGLWDVPTFIGILSDPEAKISYLRKWMSQFAVDADDVIIQYAIWKPIALSEERYRTTEELTDLDPDDILISELNGILGRRAKSLAELTAEVLKSDESTDEPQLHLEYATAIKIDVPSSKRNLAGEKIQTMSHRRWIAAIPYKATDSYPSYDGCSCASQDFDSCTCGRHNCSASKLPHLERQPSLTRIRLEQLRGLNEQILTEEQGIIYKSTPGAEQLLWHGSPKLQDGDGKHPTLGQTFNFLWGSAGDAGIFLRSKIDRSDIFGNWSSAGIIPFWTHALKTGCIQTEKLLALLWAQVLAFEDYFMSLDALSIATELYQTLSQATIHPRVTGHALYKANWYRAYSTTKSIALEERRHEIERQILKRSAADGHLLADAKFRLHLNRGEVFACIAMFEGGNCDINPNDLMGVMAFSSGNSMYIASQLLQDPSETKNTHSVRRVAGNVGQAGVAFLVPPHRPRVRKVDEFSWNVINHSPFNGEAEDCFKSTSCHLSFTNYRMPIVLENHVRGRQDVEAYFIETVVSVFDCGKWVADLDILSALSSNNLYQPQCTPKCSGNSAWKLGVFQGQMTAIDSWEEILERPQNAAVVRAHGNWLARLAMASFAIGRGYKVVVLPEVTCWNCCANCGLHLKGNEIFIV